MVKSICVDDTNKPDDYPAGLVWLELDKEYNIIRAKYLPDIDKIMVQVNEIYMQYHPNHQGWFDADRFGFELSNLEDFKTVLGITYLEMLMEKHGRLIIKTKI